MVNKIPNSGLLTNKLGILKSLQRYERVLATLSFGRIIKLKTSDFLPETYRIDFITDRNAFLDAHRGKKDIIQMHIVILISITGQTVENYRNIKILYAIYLENLNFNLMFYQTCLQL